MSNAASWLLTASFITLSFSLNMSNAAHGIELFQGGLFRLINKTTLYHSTIPILITIPTSFPSLTVFLATSFTSSSCPFHNNVTCDINKQISKIEEAIMNERDNKIYTRSARSIDAIGEALNWCCNVATNNRLNSYVKTEEEVTKHLNNLQQFVQAEHKDLVGSTQQLNTMAQSIEILFARAQSKFSTWQTTLEEQEETTVDTLARNILQTLLKTTTFIYLGELQQKIREIKLQCSTNHLSQLVINKNQLRTKLEEIQQKLMKKNYTLAFPPTETHRIYNLKITTCLESLTDLAITVHIPIKKKTTTSLYHLRSVPLYWKERTCKLIETNTLIIQDNNDIFTITETDNNCNEDLCLIPRHKTTSPKTQKCLRHLLTTTDIRSLQGICNFKCEAKTNDTIITKLQEDVYLLHDIPENTIMKCSNVTIPLPNNMEGTLKLHVPCDCEVIQDGRTLISSTYPCDTRATTIPKITQLIPISWTNLPQLHIPLFKTTTLPNYLDLPSILDHSWHLNLTEFTTHDIFPQDILEEVHMPSNYDLFINNNELLFWTIIIWQSALTIIILYLWVKNYITQKAMKLRVPFPDYNLQDIRRRPNT